MQFSHHRGVDRIPHSGPVQLHSHPVRRLGDQQRGEGGGIKGVPGVVLLLELHYLMCILRILRR